MEARAGVRWDGTVTFGFGRHEKAEVGYFKFKAWLLEPGLASAGRLRSCLISPHVGPLLGPDTRQPAGASPQSPAGEYALAAAANSVGPLGVATGETHRGGITSPGVRISKDQGELLHPARRPHALTMLTGVYHEWVRWC